MDLLETSRGCPERAVVVTLAKEEGFDMDVVCAVCGEAHDIDITQSEHVCPNSQPGLVYLIQVGTVRSKDQRKTKSGYQIRLRSYVGEREEYFEFDSIADIEAKSGDQFVLVSYKDKLVAWQNITIRRHTFLRSKPHLRPPKSPARRESDAYWDKRAAVLVVILVVLVVGGCLALMDWSPPQGSKLKEEDSAAVCAQCRAGTKDCSVLYMRTFCGD